MILEHVEPDAVEHKNFTRHRQALDRREDAEMKEIQSVEYSEYLREIFFLFLQPHHPIPRGFRRLTRLLLRAGISFEHMNTST